jgi:DNA-binding PadR family transcriptional regulator
MKGLTRKEELIMLSILRLRSEAYLVAITDHLSRIMGHTIMLTSVHLPLTRLEKMGFITSELGGSDGGARRPSKEDLSDYEDRLPGPQRA